MIGLILLVLGCASAVLGDAPPYVESSEAVSFAKVYVNQLLARDSDTVDSSEGRRHISFTILTGLLSQLMLASQNSSNYKPMHVLYDSVPDVWSNYTSIAKRGRHVLNEVSAKITLMNDLIEHICQDESVQECNEMVHQRVTRSPEIYKHPANILLSSGKVAQTIRSNQDNIEVIIEGNNEIPYLINNVESDEVQAFVKILLDAHKKLIAMQFRKFFNIIL